MSRRIIIAQELRDKLHNLTQINQESNGVLLYRQDREYCPVEGMYMTAIGTEGHVKAADDRVAIVNYFFSTHPEYKFVKFHTHTVGTIKKFGDYHAHHFSGGDREGYKEQMRMNREFIGMLVTPERILITGMDNPNLEVVPFLQEYSENSQVISAEFTEIASRLNFEQERLKGTRRVPR